MGVQCELGRVSKGVQKCTRNALQVRESAQERGMVWEWCAGVGEDVQGCIVGQERCTEVHKRYHTGLDAVQFGKGAWECARSATEVEENAQEYGTGQEWCIGIQHGSGRVHGFHVTELHGSRCCMGQGGQAEV